MAANEKPNPTRVTIRKNALLSALEGAKNTYPNEFIGLFRGKQFKNGKLELTELILPPLAVGDAHSSSFSPFFMPVNSAEKASFHSHPSPGTAYPSKQDLYFFARSCGIHFIACNPYGLQDVNCFDSSGKPIPFSVTQTAIER